MKSVKSVGLSTQPCEVPVFRLRVEEVRLPTLTCCGRSVRKSMTHEHSKEPRPRLSSLLTSLWGIMVLNTELKSTNSTYKCVRCVGSCSDGILLWSSLLSRQTGGPDQVG